MTLCPARLEPIFSPRPWGSLSLAPLFPEMAQLTERIGEAWMTGSDCRFADGPFAGQKLGEAWPAMPVEWTGTRIDRAGVFPLLVKFIFPKEKLSVQVHPDDSYAARHEQAAGGLGKTEMWYAMSAAGRAAVLVGMKPHVTLDQFKSAIADGTAENCLERIPVQAGDAVFVPAGTAHTIGPGLVLCEIQEHSDLTYRVYDYNRRDAQGRSRELHIEKALEVIRFGAQLGGKIDPVYVKPNRAKLGVFARTLFVACKYFAVEKWEFTKYAIAKSSPEHFDLLVVLKGSGEIAWGGRKERRVPFSPAQVWLIPASLGLYAFKVQSRTSLLRAHVPGDLDEFGRRLAAHGLSASDISRLVRRWA
jgi:mannose-6-phosphate isomerase